MRNKKLRNITFGRKEFPTGPRAKLKNAKYKNITVGPSPPVFFIGVYSCFLIKKILIFDVFEGGNMPEGKKSIAINVTIQSMDKTISEKDINDVSQKIINIVKAKTGGTIRS